ncbi:HAD hydrolase family protein [uncultured Brachyspira sp.]|uniref:HAD hydrolase family protein n=1 Tax=uncultured Brachyspira sp. TaxID=221953 RepID=UPI00342EE0AF
MFLLYSLRNFLNVYFKRKIKFIASDLDGTLLNSSKEITQYNHKIINDYNIEFILSSR